LDSDIIFGFIQISYGCLESVAQDKLYATQADNNYQIALLDLSQLLELETPRL